jgi:hypothetical protein
VTVVVVAGVHGVGMTNETRTRMRTLLAGIDRDLRALPAEGSLKASWGELVSTLDLGPEPEVRKCPVCSKSGMRKASRCGFCWASLQPLDEPAAEA